MKFLATVVAFGVVVSLLCSGCGSGVTVMAMVSPSINQVSPQVVTAGTPNVTVTVQGANFESQAALTVNGTAVPTTVVNSTTLAANISGTTLAQPAVAQLQVRNSDGASSNQVPLTVTSAPDNGNSLGITTTSLPSGQVGVAYTDTFTASGGNSPYTWTVSSGTLPAGLTLSTTGVLSGTPTASGSYTFSITVTDSHMLTKTITFSLLVSAATSSSALRVTTTTMPAAQVGATYSTTLSATAGTPSYTWSISSGSLPAGLVLSSSGAISGTPTTAGTSTFTVAVKDSAARTASAQESITVSPAALSITTTSLAAATKGSSYSATLSATGGTPSYTWSISSGSLPAGLTLSSAGAISGTPTTTGTSTFTVAVKDSATHTATAQESITVSAAGLSITTTSLAAATKGSSYSATLSATGGTPSYTWSISSGSLPAGLTLSSAGVISGTPTSTGTSTFTVAVKDSGSPAQTTSLQESITVSGAALSITTTSLAAATSGSSYKATLSASGGTPSFTWSISSGSLPAGLTLSSAGVISGTPTSTGTSTFTVAVKDSASLTATAQESITVSAGTLTITTVSLASVKNGSSYIATLGATGGSGSYTWSLGSGSLPAGLNLSSGGVISGTPTGSGTSTFTVAVKDSGSPAQTASQPESIQVIGGSPTITTTSLAAATDGSSYSATLSATGGTPGYTWSISSGSLPAGLTLSSSGVISGTPTATGTATFTVAVKDSASATASQQESIAVGAAASKLTITSTSLGAAQTGSSYSTTLNATGGTPSYTWSISSGSLPAGLNMSSGGVISGKPTGTGTSTFTVAVTDSSSPTQTASVQESIAVTSSQLAVVTTSLSYGTTGTNYSATVSASGGTPTYSWSVASGSLPAGLSMSSAGLISGTPTATGTSSFTVSVSDSESPTATATAQESITINAPATPGSAQIYVFPQAPVAPRGSYQTVTAIVTGVNDKTVTWTTDGGTIVGTNPCVANEPCTVALYSTSTGTYHLTATSDANHSIVATSTITMTASPVQRTDHPRFLVTSSMLPALQANATSANPAYAGLQALASRYYSSDSSIWTFSTWNGSGCSGGSGPTSDQSANYRENDAWWMTIVGLLDNSQATRQQYGCAARDVFMTNIGYVLNGEIGLLQGNRWADGALQWALTADWLMGGGYLSASDQTTVRAYLAMLAYDQINDIYNGALAQIGDYNSNAQFLQTSEWSITGMRSMGNNYTHARILVLTAAALTFNDNSTDDPPLTNTCNATRYQVCPDGTAGSLHAYWTYVSGGMLYKDWATMEDPSVVQAAYGFSSTPTCNTAWHTPTSCLGQGRGGESSEGTSYGASIVKLRWALNAIHTAGYDDPLLYGPQMSMDSMSYWDLRYVSDLTQLTGRSGVSTDQSRWNYLTDGDSLNYYLYPSGMGTEAAMLSADAYVGRTDDSAGLEWLVANSAFGGANGSVGNCQFYCGIVNELGNDYASTVALDLFISSAPDPTGQLTDPRTTLPTDWFNAGNQHIVVRDGGWTTGANTIFSSYCTNTQIDHEHQFCGGFDLYSQGEYITKGRMEFNDYNDEFSAAWNKNNLDLIQYPGQTWCTSNPWCTFNQAATDGGQFWHGYESGLSTLYHSELPGYVAAIVDDHNAFNGAWGVYSNFNGVTGASRSLIYLRGQNEVIYYDRGDTGSNAWEKATYLVATGAPTITGNTASWPTRSGKQEVFWTAVEPAQTAPSLDTTYTDADAARDWEIYGRMKIDAGSVATARFLSVLQWGPAGSSVTASTQVTSTSGTSFEGALVGSTVVMFMHDWPASFTSVTYPASGATTQYVSDLTPNTTYSISGAGAPSTATTDNAGVLTFSASGSGNITISPSGS
ncbi:MAG TPA: putative Ig domain-containing protein [Acidobacteriaceae bacterium]|nr:putative Ig domain-containing protein [Acidobacteriaceae bacterium]